MTPNSESDSFSRKSSIFYESDVTVSISNKMKYDFAYAIASDIFINELSNGRQKITMLQCC